MDKQSSLKHDKGVFQLFIMIGGLYLVQGIPIGLAGTIAVILRDSGVSLEIISWMPLVSLPWVFKFLWAPLVENHWMSKMGRRRSWIVPCQILMIIAFSILAFNKPEPHYVLPVFFCTSLAVLIGSTQDIATDGLAADLFSANNLVHINTLQVVGIMSGILIGSGGVLIGMSYWGYTPTILAIAFIILLCGVPLLFWQETISDKTQVKYKTASIKSFIQRSGNMMLIVLSLITTLGGSTIYGLTKLILVDNHWSLDEVGFITGVGGSLITILGSMIAGPILIKRGLKFAFYSGLLFVITAGVCWLIMSLQPKYITVIFAWFAVTIGCFGIGITSVSGYTLLMRRSQIGGQPATDFTIFQSIQTLGMIVVPMLATFLSATFGYWSGIFIGIAIAFGGLLFVWRYLAHYCDFLSVDVEKHTS